MLIGGKPAVVQGSWGLNIPPHVGLHPSDLFMAPPQQKGTVVQGSPTVLFGGKPAASFAKIEASPGQYKLLAVPYPPALHEAYLPATLTHEDYPGLIPAGQGVESPEVRRRIFDPWACYAEPDNFGIRNGVRCLYSR